MALRYDIDEYLTKVKMSYKKRILVEGKKDKDHLTGLLNALECDDGIKIDTSENIKGNSEITAKCNRAKIEIIHKLSYKSVDHKNLFFLIDREYLKFKIENESIEDLMQDHESDGNLSWTIGHSIENYFIEQDLLTNSYSYLSGTEFKTEALKIFNKIMDSSIKLIAAISLSAKDINKCTYPIGIIKWQNFKISNNILSLDIEELEQTPILKNFTIELEKNYRIVENTDIRICLRICRGHTAILMLQRIFASCLHNVGSKENEDKAYKDASDFQKVSENILVAALCESWTRMVSNDNIEHPNNLISLIS